MKKKILIVNRTQYGYHIDTYYYCKYLKTDYCVTYLCFDEGREVIEEDGINVKYISRRNTKIIRYLRFLYQAIYQAVVGKFDIVFIKYFQGSSLVKNFSIRSKFIIDIRSASVKVKLHERLLYDSLLKYEARKFRYVTIISKSLGKKLGFSEKEYFELPLGAVQMSHTDKTFDSIKLLYVGTLYNRNIEETIYGVCEFLESNNASIPLQYTIIGDGLGDELLRLRKIVDDLKIHNFVQCLGYIPQNKLPPFFSSHNVGVSFVPINEYYDYQPPTKTYEYLLAGMPTIATNTYENRKIISEINGVLINDDRKSFAKGICEIANRFDKYDSCVIRNAVAEFNWKTIVDNQLRQILINISKV